MANENGGKKKKKTGVILIILIIICVCVLAFSLYKVISIQMNYKQAQDEYSQLRQYTAVQEAAPEPQSETETASVREEGHTEGQTEGQKIDRQKGETDKNRRKAPISVDHEALLAQNPDYVGWLYIPALEISYPIMQGPDDDFYLHRTFEKNYLYAGSLFINAFSSRDFSDPHTVIYGHNMKDTSMFGTLRLLYDHALYTEDPNFWVMTPEEDLCYRIFSMYTTEEDSDTYTFYSGPGDIVAEYTQKMRSQSYVDTGELEANADSRVVTLSTCVYAEGTARFVVQGILEE